MRGAPQELTRTSFPIAGAEEVFFQHIVPESTRYGAERSHQLPLLNKHLYALTEVTVEALRRDPKAKTQWKKFAIEINEAMFEPMKALQPLSAFNKLEWDRGVTATLRSLTRVNPPRAISGVVIRGSDVVIQASDSHGYRQEISLLQRMNEILPKDRRQQTFFREGISGDDAKGKINSSGILSVFESEPAVQIARDAFLSLSVSERDKRGFDPDGRIFVGVVQKGGVWYAAMLNPFNVWIDYEHGEPFFTEADPTHEYELINIITLQYRETVCVAHAWPHTQTKKAITALTKASS